MLNSTIFKSSAINTFRLLAVFAALTTMGTVRADDEPRRGVLADGRAYRTDEEGNQLVDYIAELEVNVEALEKRVWGLEDEVKAKQSIIERLQGGQPAAPVVQERVLAEPRNVASVSCPRCERCEDPTEELAALKSALSNVRVELTQSKAQAERARQQLEQERNNRTQEVTSYEQALEKLEGPSRGAAQQVALLSKNLEASRQQVQREQALREQAISQYQTELRASQQALESKQEELGRLAGKVVKLEEAQSKAQARIGELQEAHAKAQLRSEPPKFVAASTQPVRQQFRDIMPEPEVTSSVARSAGVLSPSYGGSVLLSAREKAITSLRSEIAEGMARLRMSIQTRDSLFARFDQRGRALKIKPSTLRTRRNLAPERVTSEASALNNVRDLMQLRDDVRELERRVDDDIAIVRRLSKGG